MYTILRKILNWTPILNRIGKSRWFRWSSFFFPAAVALSVMAVVLGNIDDLAMSAWTAICLVMGISIGSLLTWQRQEGISPDILRESSNTDLYDKIKEEFDMSPDEDEEIAPPGAGGL